MKRNLLLLLALVAIQGVFIPLVSAATEEVAAALKPLKVVDSHFAADCVAPALQTNGFVGAISILAKGDECEVALLGYADRERQVPMTLDTMFRICSQTKGVCGVAALTFVERGELNLDDPVSKYLPGFEHPMIATSAPGGVVVLTPATNAITVRMCLAHTAGFPFQTKVNEAYGWTSVPLGLEAVIAAACEPIKFEPGTRFSYSNTGIDVAAAVLEKIAGKDFETICRERIFEPLGMRDSTFYPTAEQFARRARCYRYSAPGTNVPTLLEPYPPMPDPMDRAHRFPSAGAGLWCSAIDLFRFYRMIANRGVGDNGVRVLSAASVDEILAKSQTPKGEQEYSLGINIEVKLRGWIGHGGALNTQCVVNPANRGVRFWMLQYAGQDDGCRQAYAGWEQACEQYFGESSAGGASTEFVGRTHE